ncbi:uncharacterized protein RAG0_03011 [Rhynchosporium agropyri]|uniref:Uncharacterized protein n=1 Tax=Rhynchosporium agropyri TaxID=914238 RepID=A0A1E1K2V6_9HELO|nr:uncharacterized protein RAG0_03011 [Rhynchosporium agropyri]
MRFTVSTRSIIEQAPLQVYCSALLFAPEKSIDRKTFKSCIPSWIQTKPRVETYWSAILQILEGHTGRVTSVVFSPDGKQILNLHVSENWLVDGNTNLLWLPASYRPTCEAAWGGIITLGHSSVGVSVIQFQHWLKLVT